MDRGASCKLTILGASRSADTSSLSEPELSLVVSTFPSPLLVRRLFVFSVLNGLPDTTALSNFCTSSRKREISLTLSPLGRRVQPRTQLLCELPLSTYFPCLFHTQTPHHTKVVEYFADVCNLCTSVQAIKLSCPLFSHAACDDERLGKLSE